MALDKSSIATRTSAIELSSSSPAGHPKKFKKLSAKRIPSGGEVDLGFEMWDVGYGLCCEPPLPSGHLTSHITHPIWEPVEVLAMGRKVSNFLVPVLPWN